MKVIKDFNKIKKILKEANIKDRYFLLKDKTSNNYEDILWIAHFLRNKDSFFLDKKRSDKKIIDKFIIESNMIKKRSDIISNVFNYSDYQYKEIIKKTNEKNLLELFKICFEYKELDKLKITIEKIQENNIKFKADYINNVTYFFFADTIEWLDGRLKFNKEHISNKEALFYKECLNIKELSDLKDNVQKLLRRPEKEILIKMASFAEKQGLLLSINEINSEDFFAQKRVEYFKEFVEKLKIVVEREELREIMSGVENNNKVVNRKRL